MNTTTYSDGRSEVTYHESAKGALAKAAADLLKPDVVSTAQRMIDVYGPCPAAAERSSNSAADPSFATSNKCLTTPPLSVSAYTLTRADETDAASGQKLTAWRLIGKGVDRIEFGQAGHDELLAVMVRMTTAYRYKRDGD